MDIGDIKGKIQNKVNDSVSKAKDAATSAADALKGAVKGAVISTSDEYKALDHKTVEIKPENWNEYHPYSFDIVLADPVTGHATFQHAPLDAIQGFRFNRTSYELPLPPSALSVGLQFASAVQATNKGIIEENNGVVFRTITLTGTTGLWPQRPTKESAKGILPQGVAAFLPSTASALNNLVGQVKAVTAAAKDLVGAGDKKGPLANLEEYQLKQTGYYRFWLLHNFFVEYAEAKKRVDGGTIRLVFNSPKDNIAYVVTPVGFDLRRDSGNPLLYRYAITLRCWDIVAAQNNPPAGDDLLPSRRNAFSIRNALDVIRKARRAVQQASNTIRAVQSDINEAAQTINQGVLVLKDIVSLESDVMDFFPTIMNNLDLMIKNNSAQFAQVVQDSGGNLGPLGKVFLQGERNLGQIVGSTVGLATGGLVNPANPGASGVAGAATTTGTFADSTGLGGGFNSKPSGESVSSEVSSPAASQAVKKVLSDPAVAESIKLTDLTPMPPSVAAQIRKESAAAKELTATDVYNLTDKMKEIGDNIAYSSGMMDPEYARMYGLPAPQETFRTPTEEEIILAAEIEAGREAFLTTLASGDIYQEKELDPFTDSNDFLAESEAMTAPISKYPVIVDRGVTLEQMAALYLGDTTRAKEIALLNKLRAPYIDEKGFTRSFSTASGRTFVTNSKDNLAIGQHITIKGNLKPASRRKVLDIQDLGSGSFRVTVDGKANLDQYDAGSNPFLHARQPGTVGTGDILMIPSSVNASQNLDGRSTPISDQLSIADKVFKVDLATGPDGDLVVGPTGEPEIVYGLKNAIQAIQLKLEVEKGELNLHPNFGITAEIGQTIDGDMLANIEQEVRQTIISDPRYANAQVRAFFEGTALRIQVDAAGAGGSGRIAVEYRSET
jgi:hypothetical protein